MADAREQDDVVHPIPGKLEELMQGGELVLFPMPDEQPRPEPLEGHVLAPPERTHLVDHAPARHGESLADVGFDVGDALWMAFQVGQVSGRSLGGPAHEGQHQWLRQTEPEKREQSLHDPGVGFNPGPHEVHEIPGAGL